MAVNAWFSEARTAGGAEILGGQSSLSDPAEPRETASLTARLALSAEGGSDFGGKESLISDLSTASLKGTIASVSGQEPVSATIAAAKPAKIASAVVEEVEKTAPSPAAPSRYFIQPAPGRNWGILHSENGVDIANKCGTPIVAAATGVVTRRMTGWNSGYGNYIMIEHPNGTETRYAHMQEMYANVGDEVNQGAQIGTIGNTGKVQGGDGCHIHFEVHGARNPFVRG